MKGKLIFYALTLTLSHVYATEKRPAKEGTCCCIVNTGIFELRKDSTISKQVELTRYAQLFFIDQKIHKGDSLLFPDCYLKVGLNKPAFEIANKSKDSIRLWLNGICFKQIKPLFVTADSAVIFRMNYDTSMTSPWQLYYTYPHYIKAFNHCVEINAGMERRVFAKELAKPNTLVTTQGWMVWLAYGLFLMILIAVIQLRKGMLRATNVFQSKGINITIKEATDAEKNQIHILDVPYSIAKVQFLFWLFIVFLSILHIWGYLDTLVSPTGSVLMLLGISGGTFYIGKLIDSSLPEVTSAEEKRDFILKIVNSRREARIRFMFDVLSNGQTISLHRLQLFMFTIFLGIYFLWHVLYNLQMPQFSETMLILMGISGSTYAGVKTLEKP